MKEIISFSDFQKLDLRIGRITEAALVEGSTKLIKLLVDLGPAENADASETKNELRQIVAGLGEACAPETLVGKEIVVVVNLESKSLMGVESQGMLLAADVNGKPVLIMPEEEVPGGSVVR